MNEECIYELTKEWINEYTKEWMDELAMILKHYCFVFDDDY